MFQSCRQLFCSATAKPMLQISYRATAPQEDGESSDEPVSSANRHSTSPVVPSTTTMQYSLREGRRGNPKGWASLANIYLCAMLP